MAKATELTNENFSETVNGSNLTVVDFWAEWCGPCKLMAPIIEQLAKDYEGRVNICKLNIDEYENIAQDYDIMSIPTVCMFKNGKIVEKVVGLRQKNVLENLITKNL